MTDEKKQIEIVRAMSTDASLTCGACGEPAMDLHYGVCPLCCGAPCCGGREGAKPGDSHAAASIALQAASKLTPREEEIVRKALQAASKRLGLTPREEEIVRKRMSGPFRVAGKCEYTEASDDPRYPPYSAVAEARAVIEAEHPKGCACRGCIEAAWEKIISCATLAKVSNSESFRRIAALRIIACASYVGIECNGKLELP